MDYFQMLFKSLFIVNTEYPADSVEWCPEIGFQDYLICGTYKLDNLKLGTSAQDLLKRIGILYLYKYDWKCNILTELDQVKTAGILDQKWFKKLPDTVPYFAVANAIGYIEIYKLFNEKLEQVEVIKLNPTETNLVTLSIDWTSAQTNSIISSDSTGTISLLSLEDSHFTIKHHWKAHNYEAWTCIFNKKDSNIVYSGGDDGYLHMFDFRDENNMIKFTNKSHSAGVTSLLSLNNSNILATGSFDEFLRLFDERYLKNSVDEINLKGGIWRLKPNPFDQNLILSACMYNNFSIVNINTELLNPTMNVIAEFCEHDSICYGADWSYNKNDSTNKLCATCSFYDCKLCISSVEHIIK